MLRLSIIILVIGLIWASGRVSIASAPDRTLNEYSPKELVTHFASQYKVSETKILATLTCESSLNPHAIGDHNTSFGIAQIHLPAHTDISIEQAENPVFAIEWTAKQFAQNHQHMWTCARNLGY